MILFEFLRIGLTVIGAHKFRSALTVLSIAIGAFSIVVMASLASSATATLARGIEEVGGARLVGFFPKPPEVAERKTASYGRGIILADAEALRARLPHIRYVEQHASRGDAEIRHEATALRVDPVEVNQDFLGAFGMHIAAGRAIDRDDLVGRRQVAMLGAEVARRLFPSPEEALDKIVRLKTDSYRVIGVVAPVKRFGVGFGFDWEKFVATPLPPDGQDQAGIFVVTEDVHDNDLVKRLGAAILSDRHRQVDDFQVFDFGVLMEKFYGVFRIMHLIVGLIASVALLVGGMGVMNILLVSVSERLREIGVRKAMGASDRAVGAQFLFESALLSSFGGLAGVALGIGMSFVSGAFIRRHQEVWVTVLSIEAIAAALIASLVIGITFGVVPARRAARLSVVDCLRASA